MLTCSVELGIGRRRGGRARRRSSAAPTQKGRRHLDAENGRGATRLGEIRGVGRRRHGRGQRLERLNPSSAVQTPMIDGRLTPDQSG